MPSIVMQNLETVSGMYWNQAQNIRTQWYNNQKTMGGGKKGKRQPQSPINSYNRALQSQLTKRRKRCDSSISSKSSLDDHDPGYKIQSEKPEMAPIVSETDLNPVGKVNKDGKLKQEK